MSGDYQEINRDLISQCLKGDRRAQYRLYKLYSRSMYNICIRMVANKNDAEDVLQEAFVQAFRKLNTFRGEAAFGTWLKRIVINRCLDFLKKRKIHFVDKQEMISDVFEEEDDYQEIDWRMVHEYIKSLPEGARVVVNLYLMEGFSHKETARMLEISESTAKTQYHRAKLLLRDQLKQKMYHEKS